MTFIIRVLPTCTNGFVWWRSILLHRRKIKRHPRLHHHFKETSSPNRFLSPAELLRDIDRSEAAPWATSSTPPPPRPTPPPHPTPHSSEVFIWTTIRLTLDPATQNYSLLRVPSPGQVGFIMDSCFLKTYVGSDDSGFSSNLTSPGIIKSALASTVRTQKSNNGGSTVFGSLYKPDLIKMSSPLNMRRSLSRSPGDGEISTSRTERRRQLFWMTYVATQNCIKPSISKKYLFMRVHRSFLLKFSIIIILNLNTYNIYNTRQHSHRVFYSRTGGFKNILCWEAVFYRSEELYK